MSQSKKVPGIFFLGTFLFGDIFVTNRENIQKWYSMVVVKGGVLIGSDDARTNYARIDARQDVPAITSFHPTDRPINSFRVKSVLDNWPHRVESSTYARNSTNRK